MTHNDPKLKHYFYATIFIGTLFLAVMVFLPYLATLFLAAVLAVIFRPVYIRLRSAMKGKEIIATLVTMFIILIVIVTPFFLFGARMVGEAQNVYTDVIENNRVTRLTEQFVGYVENTFSIDISREFVASLDVTSYARPVITWIFNHVGSFIKAIPGFAINFVIGLMALYFMLKDGSKLKKKIMDLSPLPDDQDRIVFGTMISAVNSVIRGALILAVIQGFVAGIGYVIFAIPNPVLWGSITAFSALIPGIGTALILVPAVAFLVVTGSLPSAIGLAIWGMIAVGLIDNLIGPKLWGRGIRLHSLLILISVLGGIQLFGIVGFVLGPLVISLLFALIDIYPVVFKDGSSNG